MPELNEFAIATRTCPTAKAEKEAMEAKLGTNETERTKNKAILRRLEEHDKHAVNLLAKSHSKTISTAVTAHAQGKSAPITIHAGAQFEDAMLLDHVLAANAVGLLEEDRHGLAAKRLRMRGLASELL